MRAIDCAWPNFNQPLNAFNQQGQYVSNQPHKDVKAPPPHTPTHTHTAAALLKLPIYLLSPMSKNLQKGSDKGEYNVRHRPT